jgi:hypothetical protein
MPLIFIKTFTQCSDIYKYKKPDPTKKSPDPTIGSATLSSRQSEAPELGNVPHEFSIFTY